MARQKIGYIDKNYIRSKTLDEYGMESVHSSCLETRRIRERLKRSKRNYEDICPCQALEECLDMPVSTAPLSADWKKNFSCSRSLSTFAS